VEVGKMRKDCKYLILLTFIDHNK